MCACNHAVQRRAFAGGSAQLTLTARHDRTRHHDLYQPFDQSYAVCLCRARYLCRSHFDTDLLARSRTCVVEHHVHCMVQEGVAARLVSQIALATSNSHRLRIIKSIYALSNYRMIRSTKHGACVACLYSHPLTRMSCSCRGTAVDLSCSTTRS
jgi:hypothetical protein